MTVVQRALPAYVLGLLLLWTLPIAFTNTVQPDEIGVRQSNFSGVTERDLDPGWAFSVPGVHRILTLPRRYEYLEYAADDGDQLQIRTKDNNIVFIDVSVPYHIVPGEGWQVVRAGNHRQDTDGRFRFQRLAEETTVSVLRERLADLSSSDFYSTDRRLAVADATLTVLNEKLAELHLHAQRVLVRAVQFRPEYEAQLQQIQLNEQKKLLDEATENVAREQQKLDNYSQATNALAASLEQRWIERRARVERAYQVGIIDIEGDTAPGAVRRKLDALGDAERKAIVLEAAKALELENAGTVETLGDAYLLGIRNIQAETLEYDRRIRTEAEGVSARLSAEGAALVATVRGEFEGRINELLDSAAGRAYVAWKSAEYVKFDDTLVFQSGEGVPSVLRLRELTERFMGLR